MRRIHVCRRNLGVQLGLHLGKRIRLRDPSEGMRPRRDAHRSMRAMRLSGTRVRWVLLEPRCRVHRARRLHTGDGTCRSLLRRAVRRRLRDRTLHGCLHVVKPKLLGCTPIPANGNRASRITRNAANGSSAMYRRGSEQLQRWDGGLRRRRSRMPRHRLHTGTDAPCRTASDRRADRRANVTARGSRAAPRSLRAGRGHGPDGCDAV